MLDLRGRWRRKWQQWLRVRITFTPEKTLTRNNIYIVPTKAGVALVFTVALILFAAINYENNSLFLLGFSALAIFLLSIFSTFENLQGLSLRGQAGPLVQQGENAPFSVVLSHKKNRLSQALELSLADSGSNIDLVQYEPHIATVWKKTTVRGCMKIDWLKLETRYPLGLVKAWSYADLGLRAYVYPQPKEGEVSAITNTDGNNNQQRQDADDYRNIRNWQQGESPKRILWPAYARSNELLAFDFDQLAHNPRHLSWESVSGDTETKLSILCYWVLYCGRNDEAFDLHLPSKTLAMASGQQAVDAALKALATFGETDV